VELGILSKMWIRCVFQPCNTEGGQGRNKERKRVSGQGPGLGSVGEKFSLFHVLLAGLRSSLCKKEIVHRKCNAPFPKKMKIQSVIISHYQVGFPSEKKQTSWIHVWLVACPVTVNHISVSSIAKRKDNKLWIQRYMPFHSNKIVFGSMNPLALF
jgi:hypothetical protein